MRAVTDAGLLCALCDWKKKTPRRTVISRRGQLRWSSEDVDSLSEDVDQASTPKKMRSSGINGQEEMTVLIKSENRGGQRQKGKKYWDYTGLHRSGFYKDL